MVLAGLFANDLGAGAHIAVGAAGTETLYPNFSQCPRLTELFFRDRGSLTSTEIARETIRELTEMFEVGRAARRGFAVPPETRVPFSQAPEGVVRFVGLYDIIVSHQYHGKSIPASLDDEVLRIVDVHAARVVQGGISAPETLSLACGSPFSFLASFFLVGKANH